MIGVSIFVLIAAALFLVLALIGLILIQHRPVGPILLGLGLAGFLSIVVWVVVLFRRAT